MNRHTTTPSNYTPRIPCHTPTPIPPLKGGRIGVGVSGATSQPVEQHLATHSHTTGVEGVVASKYGRPPAGWVAKLLDEVEGWAARNGANLSDAVRIARANAEAVAA